MLRFIRNASFPLVKLISHQDLSAQTRNVAEEGMRSVLHLHGASSEAPKTALVTGSTSGIGLGVARGLASRGCSIILNGFGDEGLIAELSAEFRDKYGARVDYVSADLTRPAEVEALCDEAKRIYPEGVDIVVNNAGFQYVSPIEDFPEETWNDMLAVMLTAPYHIIKKVLPDMKSKGWGRIVNISSVHGLRASANKCAYVSAKHGMLGLTKVVALETAKTGVTCNAICPGYVDTPILQQQVKNLSAERGISYDDAKGEFLGRFHPSHEPIGINQVSDMVSFLCSNSGEQITGSCIPMDGGWTAK